MKTCIICKAEKPIDEFYKHRGCKDGHDPRCKRCHCDASVAALRKRMKDPEYKKAHNAKHSKTRSVLTKKYKAMFPEKYAARQACRWIKPPNGMIRHHWSYDPENARDLIYVTDEEHRLTHKHMVYDQEQMAYRSLDGILLDSRESHEKYIKEILAKNTK